MKRCALYLRVSTVDQHPETQLYDLRGLAAQRDLEIVLEYTDKISGALGFVEGNFERSTSLRQAWRRFLCFGVANSMETLKRINAWAQRNL